MSEGDQPAQLVVEADGGSRGNPGPAGYGAAVLIDGVVVAERAEFIGTATNNVAEYRGLIAGLEAAAQINPSASVRVRMDSKLVVEQMSGNWKIKHPDMRELALQAREIFPPGKVVFEWIPREKNAVADALANEAMDGGPGTVISRDFTEPESAWPELDDVGADQTTWLVLVSPGEPALPILKAIDSKFADIPRPAWVLAADDDGAKQSARAIASSLRIAGNRRKLEPKLGSATEFEAAIAAALQIEPGGCTIAVAHAAVIESEIARVLQLTKTAKERLIIAPGSVTVLRYEEGHANQVLSIGALA